MLFYVDLLQKCAQPPKISRSTLSSFCPNPPINNSSMSCSNRPTTNEDNQGAISSLRFLEMFPLNGCDSMTGSKGPLGGGSAVTLPRRDLHKGNKRAASAFLVNQNKQLPITRGPWDRHKSCNHVYCTRLPNCNYSSIPHLGSLCSRPRQDSYCCQMMMYEYGL